MKKSFLIFFPLAVAMGLIIAWIDSRPNWDDTGISVLMILIAASICGYFADQRPWLIALAVSVWIPLNGIIGTHNYGGLLALAPGFIGAYAGYLARRNWNRAG